MEFHNTDGVLGMSDLCNKCMYNNQLSESKILDTYIYIYSIYNDNPILVWFSLLHQCHRRFRLNAENILDSSA